MSKRKSNPIYVIQTCDEWKSHTSMSIFMVTTKTEALLKACKSLIMSGDACFDDSHPKKEQFNLLKTTFVETLENGTPAEAAEAVNSRLEYAFIGVYEDGEY